MLPLASSQRMLVLTEKAGCLLPSLPLGYLISVSEDILYSRYQPQRAARRSLSLLPAELDLTVNRKTPNGERHWVSDFPRDSGDYKRQLQ